MSRGKVSKGQRLIIPAVDWNDTLDSNAWVRARRADGGAGAYKDDLRHTGLVLVKNTTASDYAQFDILGIDGIVFTPTESPDEFKSHPVLKGGAPTADHTAKFCVLQEPIKAGAIGRAIIDGVTVARVHFASDSDGWCDVYASQPTKLLSATSGSARVLYREVTTNPYWAVVQLGVWSPVQIGKTDASHAKGASGDISIYTGTAGSESDTGYNISAYNRFAAVASGKWVVITKINASWYLTAAEC